MNHLQIFLVLLVEIDAVRSRRGVTLTGRGEQGFQPSGWKPSETHWIDSLIASLISLSVVPSQYPLITSIITRFSLRIKNTGTDFIR
jgi:hypothetical protein